jgi:hypothetical protein
MVGTNTPVAIPGPASPLKELAIEYVTGWVTVPEKPFLCTNVTLPVFVSTVYVPSAVFSLVSVHDTVGAVAAGAFFFSTGAIPHKRTLVGTNFNFSPVLSIVPPSSFNHGDNVIFDPCFALPVSGVAAGTGGAATVGVIVALTKRPRLSDT